MDKKKQIVVSAWLLLVILFAVWRLRPDSLWMRGWRHYEAGGGVYVNATLVPEEMEKAVICFRKGQSIRPREIKYWNYEGMALIHLGRYDEAISTFDRTLLLWPSSFTAHYRRAYALMKLKRYPEMVESLRNAQQREARLNNVVRFDEEFGHLKGEVFMNEFRDQL